MLAPFVLVALACAIEDPARPDAAEVEARLAALRERSDAYDTLEAHYRFESDSDVHPEARTLALYYRAPDEILVRFADNERSGSLWFLEERVHLRMEGESPKWLDGGLGEALLYLDELGHSVDERFPPVDGAKASATGGRQLFLRLEMNRPEPEARADFSLSAGVSWDMPLLSWLQSVDPKSALSSDEERLIFEQGGGIRLTLSARTGLFERVGDERGALVLQDATIDGELDDALFEVPDPEPEAERLEGWEVQMLRSAVVEQRQRAWLRMERALEDRGDFGVRAREVFLALHERLLERTFDALSEQVEPKIVDLAERIARAREESASDPVRLAQVESGIAFAREQIRSQLDGFLQGYLRPLEPPPRADPGSAEALLELEREAVRERFAEHFVDPMLALFAELVGG